MREYFEAVAGWLTDALRGDEVFLASYSGEVSDFVRFNRSRVRQAGHVTQRAVHLDLIAGRRHASGTLTLSGALDEDRGRLQALMDRLRERRNASPEDPHLLYATDVVSSEHGAAAALPAPDDVLDEIRGAGRARDLVGIYAGGPVHAGFANSLGQRNWFSSATFNLDWSFYGGDAQAVKSNYAGFRWHTDAFAGSVARAAEQLDALQRPARTIAPGRYRVYLAPPAMMEVATMLNWGGFGLRAHRTKTTPLLRMVEQDVALHPDVTIVENTAESAAPDFQSEGFRRPGRIPLVERGRYRQCLVSPRSAAEFGGDTNGASPDESAESFEMAAGTLPRDRALAELGTGIYVSNLWYLNFSDRSACRTTGMTRFATFWVEGGRIQAPLAPMRFDETIYRMLGERLVALTAERDFILDPDTYFWRSTSSMRLPGALIEDFTFTL